MATIHSDSIPNFITAGSPMGLRRMMLLNNAKKGAQLQYFDIQQAVINGKTVWVAWYYNKLDDQDLKEIGESE